VIDLHLHTTASDGRCTPAELVERAAAAGIRTLSVTDHDTVAAVDEVRALCAAAGLRAVVGIEITAVEAARDVHVLGYFFDPDDLPLQAFLERQRADRASRIQEIGERLAALGVPIDTAGLLALANGAPGRSLGRPLVARALIDAGHVASIAEAFDRWIGEGCPAFVAREGAPVSAVADVVHRAGGLVSLAHAIKLRDDALVARLCTEGLDALEVHHPDHDAGARQRYRALAAAHGLLVTGGSDHHGEPGPRAALGSVSLPPADWEALAAAGASAHGR